MTICLLGVMWRAASSCPGHWPCWAVLTYVAFELLPAPEGQDFVSLLSYLILRTDIPFTSSLGHSATDPAVSIFLFCGLPCLYQCFVPLATIGPDPIIMLSPVLTPESQGDIWCPLFPLLS